MGTTGADRKENTSVKIVDGGFNLWLPPEAAAPRDVEKRTSLSTLAAEVRVLLHSQSHGSDYEPSGVGDTSNDDLLGFKTSVRKVEDGGLKRLRTQPTRSLLPECFTDCC